jgi:hypothetical protein
MGQYDYMTAFFFGVSVRVAKPRYCAIYTNILRLYKVHSVTGISELSPSLRSGTSSALGHDRQPAAIHLTAPDPRSKSRRFVIHIHCQWNNGPSDKRKLRWRHCVCCLLILIPLYYD